MKESPAAFLARTAGAYTPPDWLGSLARPLDPDEPCPTLFRYPGPEGILASLQDRFRRLAVDELPYAWLSSAPQPAAPGCPIFGAVAVLEPLRLAPCVAPEPDAWLAVNASLDADCPTIWIPPDAQASALPWDELATTEQVMSAYGAAYGSRRAEAADLVAAYLEEIDSLARAGASLETSAWCERDEQHRRRVLSELGIRGRFTR